MMNDSKSRNGVILLALGLLVCTGGVQAWDVEHDEIAQLTGEFLPEEVKRTMSFDDFAVLLANCHFPDMEEWPSENGLRRFHSLEDLASGAGAENASVLSGLGYVQSNWFHSPRGRAALMAVLARSFGRGEHAHAAFCISVLSHAVADESALNHPPLLGFFRYSRLPGIDFSMRKVEEGAKNVFGFRSDGPVVHLVRKEMKNYRPVVPGGSFEDAVMSFSVTVAVDQSAYAGNLEGAIAFAPRQEAEQSLARLVTMQVRMLEDIVMTCWTHRSPTSWIPGADFDRKFRERAMAAARKLDPESQAVFRGIFDESSNPEHPKMTVGVICEAYSRAVGGLSFPGRILTAACGRTMRANGYAVRGLSYRKLANGFPDPGEVPCILMCIGGTGYMSGGPDSAFAAAARAYREKGGKLVVIGGEDVRDITGFAATMRKRGNREVPVSSLWHRGEAGEPLKMALIPSKVLSRLPQERYRFFRDPNFDGFCKPVCRMETPVGETLLELDNGDARFPVAVWNGGIVWLPEYALMPYLFVEQDPKLPLDALTLDRFGSDVLLGALDLLRR